MSPDYIRPGAVALKTTVTGDPDVTATAYAHEKDLTLTIVLVNKAPTGRQTAIQVPGKFGGAGAFRTFTSSDGDLWKEGTVAIRKGAPTVTVSAPGYGVVTLVAKLAE